MIITEHTRAAKTDVMGRWEMMYAWFFFYFSYITSNLSYRVVDPFSAHIESTERVNYSV
jgi:hypothetical protein